MSSTTSSTLLLPDRLRSAWQDVEADRMTPAAFEDVRTRALAALAECWAAALRLDGIPDLTDSLLVELGRYVGCPDPALVRQRCERAVEAVAEDWATTVAPDDPSTVATYYDRTEAFLYDLTWWHTLRDDPSPLAYVLALEFAEQRPGRRFLDFGSGVGAGALLFARHGFTVDIADISSTLLAFSTWRFAQRQLDTQAIDLKIASLPADTYDVITAMDVFEHLTDPVGAVEDLTRALRPGGYLYGRFHGETDAQRPQHIVCDFTPTFARLADLGMREVWRDAWLWGHQVFQRV